MKRITAALSRNLQIAARYVRLRPFDVSTGAGRADERRRLAAAAALANTANKILAMLVMVLSIHWAVPYLGGERFGIWMTISSLALILSFLDLGVGNAMVSRIATASARNEDRYLTACISGGLATLLLVSVLMGSTLLIIGTVLPWERMIKVSDPLLVQETHNAALVMVAIFAVGMFSNGLQKTFWGLQRSHVAHLLSAGAQAVSIPLLYLATRSEASIPVLLLCSFGLQSAVALLLLVPLYRSGLINHRSGSLVEHGRPLMRTGASFFVLQLGTITIYSSDVFLLSSTSGAASVAALALAQRLFQTVTVPLTIMNTPLWATYADALARRDVVYIRTTLKRALALTIGGGIAGSLLLVAAGPHLATLWTNGTVQVGVVLLAVMAAWTTADCCGNAFGVYLNGCGILKPQVVAVGAFCLIVLPLKYLAVTMFGVSAMVLTGALGLGIIMGITYGIVFRRAIFHPLRA